MTKATRVFPHQRIEIGAATLEFHTVQAVAQGKYEIGKVVAQGGMGAILDVRDAAIARSVAMKVMLADSTPEDAARFVQEAKITGQLEHPNIVPVHELANDERGQPYYTMKFVRGITLKKVLELMAAGAEATLAKYPLGTLLTIFQKVCDAVAFAHNKSVIHRDLKPENIMLGDFGEVLVMDWGLAKVLGAGESSSPVRAAQRVEANAGSTLAGSIMGTPQYMSPEQARGEIDELDARTDIYALGAILYHLLALRPSVSGDDAWAIVGKVARGEVDALCSVGSPSRKPALRERTLHLPGGRIPNSLAAVVRKAMALDPAARYRSVEDLQADILAYQSGFATSAEKAGAWKQFTLFVRRHKAASIGVAAVLVLSVGFTAKVITEGRRAERALANLSKTAPTLIAEGRKLIDAQKFDDALVKIRFAVEIDPRNAGYRLLLAQLQQARLELREAADEFRRVLALGPDDSAQANLALCEKLLHDYQNADALDRAAFQLLYQQMEKERRSTQAAPIALKLGRSREAAEALLQSRIAVWQQIPGWDKKIPGLPNRVAWFANGTLFIALKSMLIDDLSSLIGLPISNLSLDGTRVTDLRPLQGMRLREISLLALDKLTDLSPLKGMPLESFTAGSPKAELSDLSPLAGMKLKHFSSSGKNLRDLSLLKGMPLESLSANDSAVQNLNDVAGAPITDLRMPGCRVLTDISAVRTMPLKYAIFSSCDALLDFTPLLDCPALTKIDLPRETREIEVLRKHPGLRTIGYDFRKETPAAEFWAEFDTIWNQKADDADTRAKIRAALSAAGLPEEVNKGVKRLDDGTYSIEFGRPELRDSFKKSPDLRGLPISEIGLGYCKVTDLTPLVGLSLRKLRLNGSAPDQGPDLEPLRQCPQLEELNLAVSRRRDLSALAGLKLRVLNINSTPVANLSALAGMPLRSLSMRGTDVTDLSPLTGMPLRELDFYQTKVTDIRPVLSCPELESLTLSDKVTNVGDLRALKKLKRLSTKWDHAIDGPAQTAEEFGRNTTRSRRRRRSERRAAHGRPITQLLQRLFILDEGLGRGRATEGHIGPCGFRAEVHAERLEGYLPVLWVGRVVDVELEDVRCRDLVIVHMIPSPRIVRRSELEAAVL